MSWTRRAARAAGAGVLLTSAAVQGFTRYVTRGSRQTLEEAIKWQGDHYDISFFSRLQKQEYTVKGYQDYILHVVLCKNPKESDKYVILTHGHTDNRYGMLKYMKIYLELGYNCIIYDLRGHGLNKRVWCSYGLLESRDLVRLIDDTYQRYGKNIYLGLHGESLGSATTITALRHRPDVRFAIADCGFADLETVLTDIARSLHLGRSTVWMTWLGTRVRHRVSIFKIRPIRGLRTNKVPVMFIHGADDTYISPRHSRRMYRAVTAYKELHLIPGATHAASVLKAPEDYRRYVSGFLKKVEKLEKAERMQKEKE